MLADSVADQDHAVLSLQARTAGTRDTLMLASLHLRMLEPVLCPVIAPDVTLSWELFLQIGFKAANGSMLAHL